MLVGKLSASEAQDPRKRQFVAFWNFARTLEHSTDCRLGIWHDRKPRWPTLVPAIKQPLAVFGWPGPTGHDWAPVSLDAILKNPDLLGTGRPSDVVLARASLKQEVFRELEKRFNYRPRLQGQEDGWWFYDRQRPPKTAPQSLSTLALLPEADSAGLRDGSECLLLVDIDDQWLVLSTIALRVYQVGAALDDKIPVSFVQWDRGNRRVWNVELVPAISPTTVRNRFGKEAAERARTDAKSVVVRCVRAP